MKEIDKIKQSVIVAAAAASFALPYETGHTPANRDTTAETWATETINNDAQFMAVNYQAELGIPIDVEHKDNVDIYTYLGLELPTDSTAKQAKFFLDVDILGEFTATINVDDILPGVLNSAVEPGALLYLPNTSGEANVVIKTEQMIENQALFFNVAAARNGQEAYQTTDELLTYFYGETNLRDIVDSNGEPRQLVKVSPSQFKQSVQERINVLGPELTQVEKAEDVEPITQIGIYGNFRGWGSAAFEDIDQQYPTTDEMVTGVAEEINYLESNLGLVNAAVNFDMTTMHEHYKELGAHVYNPETPEVIDKLKAYYKNSGRQLSFSLNFAPPPNYTMQSVETQVNQLFRGEVPQFPKNWMVDNIMNLHLSFDPEPMTWGRPGEQDQIKAFINWRDMLDLNAIYINAHMSMQAERLKQMGITPAWDKLIIPEFDFYNFGTGDWDDMYDNEEISLPANLVPCLDIFGTAENKTRSVENFAERYGNRQMHMMWAFWKHLGTNETDLINLENPWEEILPWLALYNKGERFIIQ